MRTKALAVVVLASLIGGCSTLALNDAAPDAGAKPTSPGAAAVSQELRLAEAARTSGDLDAAARIYRARLDRDPGDLQAKVLLAETLQDAGSIEAAVEMYKEIVLDDAQHVPGWRGLGRAMLAQHDAEAAERTFRIALRFGPDDVVSMNGLGVALDMMGRHREAQERYAAALALDPGNDGVRSNLALSHVLSGNVERGADILLDLANRPGAAKRIRHNLAFAYGMMSMPDRAARLSRGDLKQTAIDENLAFYELVRSLVDGGSPLPDPADEGDFAERSPDDAERDPRG